MIFTTVRLWPLDFKYERRSKGGQGSDEETIGHWYQHSVVRSSGVPWKVGNSCVGTRLLLGPSLRQKRMPRDKGKRWDSVPNSVELNSSKGMTMLLSARWMAYNLSSKILACHRVWCACAFLHQSYVFWSYKPSKLFIARKSRKSDGKRNSEINLRFCEVRKPEPQSEVPLSTFSLPLPPFSYVFFLSSSHFFKKEGYFVSSPTSEP